MSTTTANYGFVKPALTDAPPDITVMNANWDKIDQELKKTYGTDNKPTASDVGAVPTSRTVNGKALSSNITLSASDVGAAKASYHNWREYTDLSEIGITEGSETFETILEEMPTYSQISYVTSGSNNKTIYPYIGGICEIKKLTNIYAKITFTMPSGGVKRGLYEKYCDYNNGGWVISNWYKFYNELNPPTASDVGALVANGYIAGNGTAKDIDNLPDGVYLLNGWSKSVVTCSVGFPFTNAYGIWIKKTFWNDVGDNAERVDIVIHCKTAEVYTMNNYDGTWHKTSDKFFNTLNKPIGTYTGNGSATQRTIQVPNILESRGVLIHCSTGSNLYAGALVTQAGAFLLSSNGTVSGLAFSNARWSYGGGGTGNLVLTTTSESLNKNGVTYTYQVL